MQKNLKRPSGSRLFHHIIGAGVVLAFAAFASRPADAAFGSNAWGSNAWGSNAWGSNAWGSNAWGSNAWGSNSWGSNGWRASNSLPTFLTSQDALKALISVPLTGSGLSGSYPSDPTSSQIVWAQINHPPSAQFLQYVVMVACPASMTPFTVRPGNAVNFQNNNLPTSVTFSGQFGLAPDWCSDAFVGPLSAADRTVVSGAMMALQNPTGIHNMVSLRSGYSPATKVLSDNVPAFPFVRGTPFTANSETNSSSVSFGDTNAGYVGGWIYSLNGPVGATQRLSACGSNFDTEVRVCPNGHACDATPQSYPSVAITNGAIVSTTVASFGEEASSNQNSNTNDGYNVINCPTGLVYTPASPVEFLNVQVRSYATSTAIDPSSYGFKMGGPTGASGASNQIVSTFTAGSGTTLVPATEDAYLNVREGTWYGDVLDPKMVNVVFQKQPSLVSDPKSTMPCLKGVTSSALWPITYDSKGTSSAGASCSPSLYSTWTASAFAAGSPTGNAGGGSLLNAYFIADKTWTTAQTYSHYRACSSIAAEGCLVNDVLNNYGYTAQDACKLPGEMSNNSSPRPLNTYEQCGSTGVSWTSGAYAVMTSFLPSDDSCAVFGPAASGFVNTCTAKTGVTCGFQSNGKTVTKICAHP